MTTRALLNLPADLPYESGKITRTVRGGDMMNAAMQANIVALARPSRGFELANLAPGDYVASYRRSHDAIKQAWIMWSMRTAMPVGTTLAGETLSVDLTITDALGNSVASSDARIPIGFKAETYTAFQWYGHPGMATLCGVGWLDLDALATTLTDPSWSFEFTIAWGVSNILRVDVLHMREVARTVVDTSDTYGVDHADFQPGQPASAGSSTTVGALRLAQTIDGAAATQPDILTLAWPEDITATIPKTTAAAYAAMTNFEQSAGVPMRFRVPVRPLYTAYPSGSAAGEAARWRVRYYVAGGGTADIELLTGSGGSPYAITGLTGAAWAWSAWMTCALPTDGTDTIATLSVKAQTSAGTVYISGIHVQQT